MSDVLNIDINSARTNSRKLYSKSFRRIERKKQQLHIYIYTIRSSLYARRRATLARICNLFIARAVNALHARIRIAFSLSLSHFATSHLKVNSFFSTFPRICCLIVIESYASCICVYVCVCLYKIRYFSECLANCIVCFKGDLWATMSFALPCMLV